MKVCAVTTALVCAGGGALIGHGSASGTATPPPSSLDHYLCVGELDTHCVPAKTTLPDGTTFEVSNPRDRFDCDRVHDGRRRHGNDAVTPTPVTVTNELSSAPVTLLQGRLESTCRVVTLRRGFGFSHGRASTNADAQSVLSCFAATYPANPAPKFDVPLPLKIGDRLLVKVLDPAQLCVPTTPSGPAVAPAAVSGSGSLLCFRVRVAFRANHWFPSILTLCVPTTVGAGGPGSPGLTTTTAGATTTTAGSTTTTSTTTTTTVPGSTTTTTGSTTSTSTSTTTSSTTTTSTTAPATTTTRVQPCPGILVNGVCIITV